MILSIAKATFNIVFPLEVESCSDVCNFDSYGDRIDCSELTESVLDLEKFSEAFELRLFFNDYLNVKPSPFLF